MILGYYSRYSLKVTGIEYLTATTSPLCLPGVHLGICFNTRTASLSSDGKILLFTSKSDVELWF